MQRTGNETTLCKSSAIYMYMYNMGYCAIFVLCCLPECLSCHVQRCIYIHVHVRVCVSLSWKVEVLSSLDLYMHVQMYIMIWKLMTYHKQNMYVDVHLHDMHYVLGSNPT